MWERKHGNRGKANGNKSCNFRTTTFFGCSLFSPKDPKWFELETGKPASERSSSHCVSFIQVKRCFRLVKKTCFSVQQVLGSLFAEGKTYNHRNCISLFALQHWNYTMEPEVENSPLHLLAILFPLFLFSRFAGDEDKMSCFCLVSIPPFFSFFTLFVMHHCMRWGDMIGKKGKRRVSKVEWRERMNDSQTLNERQEAITRMSSSRFHSFLLLSVLL